MEVILNDAQRTSLSITLSRLEIWLTQMQAMLDRDELRMRLAPDNIERIRALTKRQQAIVDELSHRFDLPRETTDDIRRLVAGFSVSWSQLCDARSDKLSRYGAVDLNLSPALDPDLDQLIEMTLGVIHILEQAYQP